VEQGSPKWILPVQIALAIATIVAFLTPWVGYFYEQRLYGRISVERWVSRSRQLVVEAGGQRESAFSDICINLQVSLVGLGLIVVLVVLAVDSPRKEAIFRSLATFFVQGCLWFFNFCAFVLLID